MRAGQITRPGKIELVSARAPDALQPGEVLFQPALAGLCGSDSPYFLGARRDYPLPPGVPLHELVGSVVKSRADRFAEGDRVIAYPPGLAGCFERFVVPCDRVVAVDAALPSDDAVFAQPLSTVFCALGKLGPLDGLSVAIVGQGPLGLLFSAVLRSMGATRVIGVDRLEHRLKAASRCGATETINIERDDPVQALCAITQDRLVDVAIECVGHQDNTTDLCGDLCRPEGRILCFGVPSDQIVIRNWGKIFRKNLTIITSVGPDRQRDGPRAMAWLREHSDHVRSMVTHRFCISQIQRAFEVFAHRQEQVIKVLIDFDPG